MESKQNKKLRTGWLVFMIIAGFFIVGGLYLIQDAFAVNATAINEIQSDLSSEISVSNSFSIFWIIFFLVILAVFMFAMIIKREWREMIFFSIGALIVSVLITLLFTSPMSFDYQTSQNKITVEEITYPDGTITYNSGVTNTVDLVVIIPPDTEFRFAMVSLFTGISMFNGLYSIFILTNFDTRKH